MDTVRKCNKCNKTKELNCFPKDKKCTLGHVSTCKECRNEYGREWKRNSPSHKLKRREHQEKYKAIAKEKAIARKKALKKNNPQWLRCTIMRSGMVERSKKGNLPFDKDVLTNDFLNDRLNKNPNCECCGKNLDMSFKSNGPNNDSPSIDKITPILGYVVSNISILCWRCNNLKRDANSSELLTIANWLREKENEVNHDE